MEITCNNKKVVDIEISLPEFGDPDFGKYINFHITLEDGEVIGQRISTLSWVPKKEA